MFTTSTTSIVICTSICVKGLRIKKFQPYKSQPHAFFYPKYKNDCREDVSRYFPNLSSRIKVSLVEASDKILGAFDERMIKYAHSVLSERGVKIQTGSAVTEVTSEYVEMKVRAAPSITIDGKVTPSSDPPTIVRVPYGSLVWAGGITSRPITKSIASNIGMQVQIKTLPYCD